MNPILIQMLLGAIQGITEWLPVSSSGMITLINVNFLGITDAGQIVHQALFLHLGTFFAALVYFRKEVKQLFITLFRYKYQDEKSKKTLIFLIISTAISGIVGLLILEILLSIDNYSGITGKSVTAFVSILLLLTGIIQIKTRNRGLKTEREIKNSDGVLLGLVQGLSSLPGVSRSGITISTLLLKKFDDTTALRLSFLMSLPIVLIGNIFLNAGDFAQVVNSASLAGLLVSFVFGILTISGMLRISRKINFGWFVLIFALLMLGSLLV